MVSATEGRVGLGLRAGLLTTSFMNIMNLIHSVSVIFASQFSWGLPRREEAQPGERVGA